MTTFFLIRHADCDGVGKVLWGRQPDVHLNPDGKSSAAQLAKRVAQMSIEAVYSSPLERATETAAEIARRAGDVPVNVSDKFNELDYGEWTSRSVEELAHDPTWQRYNAFRSRTRIPAGESIMEAQSRIVGELRRLAQEHEDQNVAVVTHADVIKAALA